jgi:hypothetical protein
VKHRNNLFSSLGIIPGVRVISHVSNKSTLGSNTPYLLKYSIFGICGSTLTLISYNLFMKMCTDKELKLQKNDCQIKDANGKNLKTYPVRQMLAF